MRLFRNPKVVSHVARTLLCAMALELFSPLAAYALTSGPTQPEAQGFEPATTTDMVDLLSGDFTYNIPLFELPGPDGGYPFNLAYHSGVGMDEEASWVGLGWSLNPGILNRQMRGIPDEFNGDQIVKTVDMKNMHTVGVGTPGIGFELFGAGNFNIAGNLYYNNFKGLGIGIDIGIGYGAKMKDGKVGNLGIAISNNSQEGLGFDVNTSLDKKIEDGETYHKGGFINLKWNSRRGLTDITLNRSKSNDGIFNIEKTSGSGFSFSNGGAVPSVGNAMNSTHLSATFKTGPGAFGAFPHLNVNGYYAVQKLEHKNQPVPYAGFGYNYTDKVAGEDIMMDFNREQDGLVGRNTRNLSIPNATIDVYSIMGQGIGSMFRSWRSDVPVFKDSDVKSKNNSIGGGVDIGGGHAGVNGAYTHSSTSNENWNYANVAPFLQGKNDEPYYYKVYGEQNASDYNTKLRDAIKGDRVSYFRMETSSSTTAFVPGTSGFMKLAPSLIHYDFMSQANPQVFSLSNTQPLPNQRAVRANTIFEMKNKYVDRSAQGDFNPRCFSGTPSANNIPLPTDIVGGLSNRSSYLDSKDKPAGFSTVNDKGMRYVYGIAALNKEHKEHLYSVQSQSSEYNNTATVTATSYLTASATEKYKSVTSIPEYAHAFLLTAVLGSDYVDITGDGPTNDDLGYWVRFDYIRTNDDYQWRAPFRDANYNSGRLNDKTDDKASFLYGKRENWYLAAVETRTHRAEFYLSPREDAKGVASEFQTSSTTGLVNNSYRLDKIALYSKAERIMGTSINTGATPIKTVLFDYTYNLCPGIHNGTTGKLTLNRLSFKHQNNTRGTKNAYEFVYGSNPNYSTVTNIIPTNSSLSTFARYDRWGNYRNTNEYLTSAGFGLNDFAPWTNQSNTADEDAKAWNLSEINLPSGATIKINYEADDYAYVQNKPAMRMYKIDAVFSVGINSNPANNTFTQKTFDTSGEKRHYVAVTVAGISTVEDFKRYCLDKNNQLFFKVDAALLGSNTAAKARDFVSGYAIVEPNYIEKRGTNQFLIPIKHSEQAQADRKDRKWHPIQIAILNYLQAQRADIAYMDCTLSLPTTNDNITGADKISFIKEMAALSGNLFSSIRGYYSWATTPANGYAQGIGQDSWVRLNEPTGKKKGGGCRVQKIEMIDNWKNIPESTTTNSSSYGQVYEYTTKDEDGRTISSGVATNEPSIGSEENALKTAKFYMDILPLHSDYQLFTETPINESLYPGASVGYSKVTVKSIATQAKIAASAGSANSQISATGAAVHEFYTAKDFPIFTEETPLARSYEPNGLQTPNNENKPMRVAPNIPIIVPFIGTISSQKLAASQGYRIELNDMHGKPKKVSYYGMSKLANGVASIKEEPFSWVEYLYEQEKIAGTDKPKVYTVNHYPAYRLNNFVSTLDKDRGATGIAAPVTTTKELGVEYEMVVDLRRTEMLTHTFGLSGNMDISGLFGFPIITAYPNLGRDVSILQTVVNNKVVHRTGIPKATRVYKEGALTETQNLVYDALTGEPLLTQVNDNFDNPLFNYATPAHWTYKGMGPAYENIGYTFTMPTAYTIDNSAPGNVNYWVKFANTSIAARLKAGDELLVNEPTTATPLSYKKYYCMRVDASSGNFWLLKEDGTNPSNPTDAIIIRSGNRNMLTAKDRSVTSQEDPLTSRTTASGSYTGSFPNSSGTVTNVIIPSSWSSYTLNKVLQISATQYKDVWMGDYSLQQEGLSNPLVNLDVTRNNAGGAAHFLPYKTGEMGVWRPWKNYTYKADRIQDVAAGTPKLRDGGRMDATLMFEGQYPFWSSLAAKKWVPTQEMTLYNPANFDIENKDALGIYSAAIYGFGARLTTAVAANASYREIAYESFEDAGSNGNWNLNPNMMGGASTALAAKTRYIEVVAGNGSWALVNAPANQIIVGSTVKIEALVWDNGTCTPMMLAHPVAAVNSLNANQSIVTFASPTLLPATGKYWVGKIGIPSANTPSATSANISISPIAHTGNSSLKVACGTNVRFNQSDLQLVAGKKYNFSAWVKLPSVTLNGAYSLPPSPIDFIFGGSAPVAMTIRPELVEGWQKVEMDFICPSTYTPGTNISIGIQAPPCSTCPDCFKDINIDDIRLVPTEGSLKSYVYNSANFRLMAELDENNFATFYEYDDQGQLFLTRKETYQGIKTLQESQLHLQEK